MKELIDFLEKKGFTWQANNLKNGATSLNFRYDQIGDGRARLLADALKTNSSITSLDLNWNKIGVVADKEIEEKINYNKILFQKLTSLLYNFYTNTDYTLKNPYAFKVLTANKFYQLVNKELLKESLQEQGIKDVESMLKKVDDLIKMKPFTIADVCKNIQPDTKVAPGELHISNLPTEIMDNILAYVGDTPWGWEVEAIGNTVEPAD